MKRLSEETLNAYADGALDAGVRAEVEAQLAADPEARALLEKLRRADSLAIEAFAAPMHEPPPQALIDAILRRPAPGSAADRDAPRGARRPRAWSIREYAMPMAAALVVAAGISAAVLLWWQPGQGAGALALGAVPDGSALHRLLEARPSGSTLDIEETIGSVRRLGVVATFRDRHARPCREVEALAPDGQPIAAAIACRNSAGQWMVEGATRLATAPQGPGPHFEPSGVPEKEALEGLLTMLGAQRALGPAEERALIERGWRN